MNINVKEKLNIVCKLMKEGSHVSTPILFIIKPEEILICYFINLITSSNIIKIISALIILIQVDIVTAVN